MTIETERLVLRHLTLEDSSIVEELASNYEIAKSTLTIPYPYPKGSASSFIASVLEQVKEGKLFIYAITRKEDCSLVGIINLSINRTHNKGELAYWVGVPYWGKGYGTEAAQALIQYGFEQGDLNKIFAAAFTDNPGSWRIMEKIGMKYEGTFRQHVLKWDEYKDLAYYGILKQDYLENLK